MVASRTPPTAPRASVEKTDRSGGHVLAMKQAVALLMIIVSACVFVGLDLLGSIDTQLYGLLSPAPTSSNKVAAVIVDTHDTRDGHAWPWPTDKKQELLNALARASARWVVLDPEFADGDGRWWADSDLRDKLVLPLSKERIGSSGISAPFCGWQGDARRFQLHAPDGRLIAAATGLLARSVGSSLADAQPSNHALLTPSLRFGPMVQQISAQAIASGDLGALGQLNGKIVFVAVTRPVEHTAVMAGATTGTAWPPGLLEATLASSLAEDRIPRQAALWQSLVFALIWPLALWFAARRQPPRRLFWIWASLMLAALGTATAVVHLAYVWLGLLAPMLMLLVLGPWWAWMRVDLVAKALTDEVKRLNAEPSPFPEPPKKSSAGELDPIQHDVVMLHQAVSRVRALRRFLDDALANVPDPTLVVTTDGFVAIANTTAKRYFRQMGIRHPDGAQLPYLLARFDRVDPNATGFDFSWWDIIDPARAKRYEAGIEVRDSSQRHWVVRCALATGHKGKQIGWIATLHDISTIRDAERRRDETLRFLSHDLRSPQSAIITLIELERTQGTVGQHAELFSRLEKLARHSLALADDFVQLARAETSALTMRELDLSAVLEQSIDGAWAAARAKNTKVELIESDTHAIIVGDSTLISRAIANLIDNAIKYSPADSSVRCRTELRSAEGRTRWAVVSIRDHGYGIAPEDQPRLFQRFSRVQREDQPAAQGAGLGLAFVKTVMDRHGGRIEVASRPGEGSDFRLLFPAYDTDRI